MASKFIKWTNKELLEELNNPVVIAAFEGWNDNFMRSVPALPRADKNPEDLDTHAEDHAADEWRYGMVHMYRHAEHKDDPIMGSGQNILDALPGRPAHSGRYHVLN